MDITGTVLKITMNFKLGGSEIAQFGLHARWDNEDPVEDGIQGLAEKYRDNWVTELSDSRSGFCSSVVADWPPAPATRRHAMSAIMGRTSNATMMARSAIFVRKK